MIEVCRKKSVLNTYAIIFHKRTNINISASGICLFALIAIPYSSPTCSTSWELGKGEVGQFLQSAFLNCLPPVSGQWTALNGHRGEDKEGSQGISLPCFVWHFPQRWHLLNGSNSSWTGVPWIYLPSGDPASWALERLPMLLALLL